MVSRTDLEEIVIKLTEPFCEDHFKNKVLKIVNNNGSSFFLCKIDGLAETISYSGTEEHNYYFTGFKFFETYIGCEYRVEKIDAGPEYGYKKKVVGVETIEYMIPYDSIAFMSLFKTKTEAGNFDMREGEDLI